MSERKLAEPDVVSFFHSVLFAYQKALKDVLGETSTSLITEMTVPITERIIEKVSPELANTKNADDALKKFADLLMASGFVGQVNIEKDDEKYILHISKCVFAEHVHAMLSPKDVTCPWAIFAMSIVQKTSKQRVKMQLSEFSDTGSKTSMEFL